MSTATTTAPAWNALQAHRPTTAISKSDSGVLTPAGVLVPLLVGSAVFALRRLAHRGSTGRAGEARSGRRRVPTEVIIYVGGTRCALPVWAIGVTVGLVVLVPALAIAFALVVFARAFGSTRRADRTQTRAWERAVPDLVELVRLALGSGCTIHLSLLLIADNAGGLVGSMLDRTASELRSGNSTAEALTDLQIRVGAPVRPLCAALLGSERYGLPLAATLEALAVEARLARQREAEMRSRRLPVLLLFPLVVCILPAFALLTVVPLLGGGLSSVRW